MTRGRPRTLSDEDRVLAARAHQQVARAVKRGDLVKPARCACGGAPVQGHHADYSKPLEVEWLCSMCHRSRHGALKAAPDGTYMVNFRVEEELADKIDAAAGGNRSAWMRAAVVAYLGLVESGGGPVREVRASRSEFLTEAMEHGLEVGIPPQPRKQRRPKVERLEVARAVKSSAEAKAGLRPLNDWRGGDDAA